MAECPYWQELFRPGTGYGIPLGRQLASDVFESYSAGTERKDRINPDAVRLMKQLYHIDMETEGQHSKLLSDLPALDGVVTMDCNVQCPCLPCQWREDWGLEDPAGKPDAEFLKTIRLIEEKVLLLRERYLQSGPQSRRDEE